MRHCDFNCAIRIRLKGKPLLGGCAIPDPNPNYGVSGLLFEK